jgi:ribosomal protein L11 methylase PrmA
MNPARHLPTTWQDYDRNTSYSDLGRQAKEKVVAEYAQRRRPGKLIDVACNSGHFSEIALQNGAGSVVGIDVDEGAIQAAIQRADEKGLEFLPLLIDASNPSPNQGWGQEQWQGLHERANFDGLLGLALIHHLIIARNIPMGRVVDWLIALSPSGIVEFVPKSDPMVQAMLSRREDIFPDYTLDSFLTLIRRKVRVSNVFQLPNSNRVLIEYEI